MGILASGYKNRRSTCCSAQRRVDQFLFYVAAHELSAANLGNCGKNGAATNAEVTDGFTWTRQALYQFDAIRYGLLPLVPILLDTAVDDIRQGKVGTECAIWFPAADNDFCVALSN